MIGMPASSPIWDLSFIGVMHPYRVQLVDQLREMGISVAVNPHRTDRADDPESSRADHRIAGKGRFGVVHQWRMAFESMTSYSPNPLRLMAGLGALLSAATFVWFLLVMATYFSGRIVDGWIAVMSAVLIVGGLTFLSLLVGGSYVARIHDILKSHPRSYVDHTEPRDEEPRREGS